MSFPVNENYNGNGLKEHLSGEKVHRVEKDSSGGNPLGDFLREEKAFSNEPPEMEEQETAEPTSKGPSKPKSEEQPTGGAPESETEPPYERDLNYKRHAEKIIRMWDQAASRLLNWLAKDENRKRWKLTQEDVDEIMEWMPDVAERYKLTIDNPVIGLMITLGLIYGPKVMDAVELRNLKRKIEEEQEKVKYWKRKAGYREEEEEEPVYAESEPTEEQVNKVKSTFKNRRAPGTEPEDVEIIEEVVFTESDRSERSAKGTSGKEKFSAQANKSVHEEFDLESQIDREFFGNSNSAPPNSTGKQAGNSTNGGKTNGAENKNNAVEDRNSTDDFIYSPVSGRDGFAAGPDGTVEPFEPLKEDKRGRPTEVVRCKMTRRLFERFAGSNKKFINNEAKNRYNYLLKQQAEGRTPKDGFPKWWNTG